MADYNYVETFRPELQKKYARELTSSALTANGASFIGTKTIKLPRLDVGGYGMHSRAGSWNRKAVANDWDIKELKFDRDVEFFVDVMDVDETSNVLSAGNVTNEFEESQAIPELDAYRYSKIYSEFTDTYSKSVDTTALTEANILQKFDALMEDMDDKSVPESGRILYCTAAVKTLLKNAEGIYRNILVNGTNDGSIRRSVRSLDEVQIQTVPSDRFKTEYDFSDGWKPATGAKQINFMLVHPNSISAVQKHSAIYLFPPGAHQQGDGYLYQNRRYGDLFLYGLRLDAIGMNVSA